MEVDGGESATIDNGEVVPLCLSTWLADLETLTPLRQNQNVESTPQMTYSAYQPPLVSFLTNQSEGAVSIAASLTPAVSNTQFAQAIATAPVPNAIGLTQEMAMTPNVFSAAQEMPTTTSTGSFQEVNTPLMTFSGIASEVPTTTSIITDFLQALAVASSGLGQEMAMTTTTSAAATANFYAATAVKDGLSSDGDSASMKTLASPDSGVEVGQEAAEVAQNH